MWQLEGSQGMLGYAEHFAALRIYWGQILGCGSSGSRAGHRGALWDSWFLRVVRSGGGGGVCGGTLDGTLKASMCTTFFASLKSLHKIKIT